MLERLAVHLKSLEHQELISSWYDGDITPGSEWNKQILDHLNAAQIIILLISPDFIASQFCYSIEMKQAIVRHENQQACVIPIILRPTYWEKTPFAKLQAIPTEGKHISTWRLPDEAWKNVVQGIQKAILEREKSAVVSALNASAIDELCQQYCHKLYDQWKMLDFKGIQYSDSNNLVSIPFLDVFVLPDVLVGLPQYEKLEREEAEENILSGKEAQGKGGETEQGLTGKSTSRLTRGKQVVLQRESLHTVFSQHRQLVILGDPGSGKSALLKYLLLTLAEGRDAFRKAFPQPATATQVVCPVYIPLSIYAEIWPTHTI